jgi:branched-chain amino acid aminotransferase
MTAPLIWMNGSVFEAEKAMVAASDHGLLLGDGCFETIAVRGGTPRFLDRHLRRLRHALGVLHIADTPTDAELHSAITALIDAHATDNARVRITITPGPGDSPRHRGTTPLCAISITSLPTAPLAARIMLSDRIRNERSPITGIKSTSWSENAALLRAASATGFDNALVCDSTGRLSECATASLFLVIDGDILTPSLDSGCLPGIIREVLLDSGIASESNLHPDDLDRADEVFITSSTTGVLPVAAVDQRQFPIDGPITARAVAVVSEAH